MNPNNTGNAFLLKFFVEWLTEFSVTEKRPSQPVLQHSTKKSGQPLEEVHVYSNKNRLLAKDSGQESDKYVNSFYFWVKLKENSNAISN